MYPQDYNSHNDNQPPDQSAEAWFNNVDTPAPASSIPPPATSKKPNKRRLIIIVSCVTLLILLIPTAYLLTQPLQQACLRTQDYKDLFGTEMKDAIDARNNFYTESIIFDEGSSEYNELTEKDTETLIKSAGRFYAKYHEAKSIIISLSTTYAYEEVAPAATERLKKVQASLISSGVNASAIKTSPPLLAPLQPDDEEARDDIVLLKITSEQDCHE
ncbi:MAG TPA: hypothetical protein VGE13_04195 [Candidatus Saccharimonadales bacterium]